MAEQDLAAIARTIIDANQYMTLATADVQGQPWASPVFYATADYTDFYWISAPETTHSENLAQRGICQPVRGTVGWLLLSGGLFLLGRVDPRCAW